MPIGDLLAQITGQPSAPTSTPKPSLTRVNTVPKRKADDEIRKDAPKTPRTSNPPIRPVQASRPLDRQSTMDSKPLYSANKPSIVSSKPMNGSNKIAKPQPTTRPNIPLNGAASSPVVKSTPKKGSFAEIMARGSKAQAVMGQVGKIQHKKVEGGIIKKEKEAKAEQRPIPGKRSVGYSGSASLRKDGPTRNGSSSVGDGANGRRRSNPAEGTNRPKLSTKQQAELDREQERKMKKLSQPSSYAGTARGKPAPSKRPGSKPMPRGGALLNAPKTRPSKGSRYDEDEYDEELDDFIDYDDEEDDYGGGPRYEYASDASSDMEAGLEDIDSEERRAERIARQEDIEEQRLEERLKMDKEARKRKALEELRARQRR